MNKEKTEQLQKPISRLLNSAGTTAFIKYFDEFKAQLNDEDLIEIFKKNGDKWSSEKQIANNGKRIFRDNREIEALEHIILKFNPNRVQNGLIIKDKAIMLYKSLNLNQVIDYDTETIEEKKVFVKYRLQQSKFRRELLLRWEGCSITDIKNPKLLIASHIKPFSESEEAEKYDVNNGLLLTPLYDKLFDLFLITFDENGKIRISKDIKSEIKVLNISREEKLRKDKLTVETRKYLKFHNQRFKNLETGNEKQND